MKRDTVFQLALTKDIDGSGDVYSLLALYPNGETYISRFVYDITRIKEKAENILGTVRNGSPGEDELVEFISELL